MEKIEKFNYICYWETTKESGLEELKAFCEDLFSRAPFIPTIYYPILYKFLINPQIKFWDMDIFSFVENKLQEIESAIGEEKMRTTLYANFHQLADAYQCLLDIEDRIILMNRFKGSEELKAKVFSINIYNDLLNTAFNDLLELFVKFESVSDTQEYTRKTLTPKIEFLSSNKRGYQKITDLANPDIRNAISHGGVEVNDSDIVFTYQRGNQYFNKKSGVYDFKDSLLQLFDGASAIILAWFGYLCEKNISYKSPDINSCVDKRTFQFFERLSLSTLHTNCDRIYLTDVNKNAEKSRCVNVDFSGCDLDINSRMFFGIQAASEIFYLKKLDLKDTIMVTFDSSKIIRSFFSVSCSVIKDFTDGKINMMEVRQIILDSKNVFMFPINDEDRNEFEDVFRYYPDIETDDYRITEIEDISIDDKKRMKAVAYLKKVKRPYYARKAIVDIVNRLKSIENYGFTSHKVKYGKMNADIIYIVVYKREVRRGKDRALFPNNDNFIVQIQYDVDMKFPLNNNFVDKYLKKRREGQIEYNWNPNF